MAGKEIYMQERMCIFHMKSSHWDHAHGRRPYGPVSVTVICTCNTCKRITNWINSWPLSSLFSMCERVGHRLAMWHLLVHACLVFKSQYSYSTGVGYMAMHVWLAIVYPGLNGDHIHDHNHTVITTLIWLHHCACTICMYSYIGSIHVHILIWTNVPCTLSVHVPN